MCSFPETYNDLGGHEGVGQVKQRDYIVPKAHLFFSFQDHIELLALKQEIFLLCDSFFAKGPEMLVA